MAGFFLTEGALIGWGLLMSPSISRRSADAIGLFNDWTGSIVAVLYIWALSIVCRLAWQENGAVDAWRLLVVWILGVLLLLVVVCATPTVHNAR